MPTPPPSARPVDNCFAVGVVCEGAPVSEWMSDEFIGVCKSAFVWKRTRKWLAGDSNEGEVRARLLKTNRSVSS